jgi:transcriptional regulator with XRE-family HTH domain
MVNTLSYRIKSIRKELRLTQNQFSNLLGFTSNTAVSLWESNEREPDLKTLIAIAKLCNKSLDWLLTGEERETGGFVMENNHIGYGEGNNVNIGAGNNIGTTAQDYKLKLIEKENKFLKQRISDLEKYIAVLENKK